MEPYQFLLLVTSTDNEPRLNVPSPLTLTMFVFYNER